MLYIDEPSAALPVFRALDSDIRLKIVGLLARGQRRNMNELAEALGVTNAAITAHIKVLNEAGLVGVSTQAGRRGTQKICYLNEDTLLVKLAGSDGGRKSYEVELGVGLYSDYAVASTCGLATAKGALGMPDKPSAFASPARVDAEVLWFAEGFVEYRFPNQLPEGVVAEELQLSFEISSEAPGYGAQWPSDITFALGGTTLGIWTCPATAGDARGDIPLWQPAKRQAGILKLLAVNKAGTFLDGMPFSGVTLGEVHHEGDGDFRLRIACPAGAANPGGVTLYGVGVGGFKQGIKAKVLYSE